MLVKFLKHTAIYGLAPQINLIASFIALPFITEFYDDIDFGIQTTLLAYLGAFSAFSNLGLNLILTNTFFKHKYRYKLMWRQIYGFLLIWNIIYSSILFCILYMIIPKEVTEYKLLIVSLAILPITLFSITKLIGNSYLQYNEQPKQVAYRSLIFGLLSIGLQLLFIVYFKLHYLGWFIAYAISYVLSNMSYIHLVYNKINLKPIFNFKLQFILRQLKITLPIIPHQYSTYLLNSSDKIVMDQLGVESKDIGNYHVANTFGSLLEGLSYATTLALNPSVNSAYVNKKDINVKYIIFSLQLFYYILTFNLALWLKEIFSILFIKNPLLITNYSLGIVLIMSYNFRPLYYGNLGKLFLKEKTKHLWKVSLLMGVLNIILNIILIPIYGYQAAAYTTLVSFYLLSIAPQILTDYKSIMSISFNSVLIIIASVLLALIVYNLRDINLYYKLIISLAFTVIFGYIMLKLNKKIS